ncbi:MAG: hypothetical protein ALECFALPRED_006751 [Alectoria fallacina]|uniref:SGNH hydrolase-type esterase domain-containing protein n=1 Tax=Alectoria fallacina TaxID=1903189 RepID=A0A8H3IQ73_9LECA|nr:MAG: hypothetical protein ALECFALPRED_006751 [Alectoria fallacina]
MAESGAMIDPLPKSLRILCFGDSLTAGYTSYGWEFHPYADHLRVGLQHTLSISDIEVDVAGLSGDQVQGSYLPRIRAKCANTDSPYDWIIIMGGTNDLAWGQSPDTIYEGLSKPSLPLPRYLSISFCGSSPLFTPTPFQDSAVANWIVTEKVWKVALDTGANVLALNVLEADGSGDRVNSKRNSLNDKIANHQQERFYSFDIYSAIRYTGIDKDLREKLWDDGLHLTSEGYKVMGDVIAVRMLELLKMTQQPKNIGPIPN